MNTTTDRKQYLLLQKQKYRRTHKSVTLSYRNSEAKILMKAAEGHGLKLHEYLRQCITSYRNNLYVLPDEKRINNLEVLVLRCGTNINQAARRCNQGNLEAEKAIQMARAELKTIDNFITKTFRSPPLLEEYLLTLKAEHPEKVRKVLIKVLAQW